MTEIGRSAKVDGPSLGLKLEGPWVSKWTVIRVESDPLVEPDFRKP